MATRIFAVALLLLLQLTAQAQTVRYIHTDALGSVVAVTDANRNVVERREYEPYGAVLTGVKDGPGYTGHVTDLQTGLSYMQQRYYDPALGMFMSADPVTAFDGPFRSFHRYRYADNNPYRFNDPDGRQSREYSELGEILVTGISAYETPSTMNDRERLVAGAFGTMDVIYGSTAFANDVVGGVIAVASPADGPLLDAVFAVHAGKNAMQTIDGFRNVLSAIDGKERPSTFEQAGEFFGGESGATAGKIVGTVMTFTGAAKAATKAEGSFEEVVDVIKPLFEKPIELSK